MRKFSGTDRFEPILVMLTVAVRVFILETVSVFRKYLGFIDSVFIKPNALICTSDWINRTNIQVF